MGPVATYQVLIFGETYTIVSDEPEAFIHDLASQVDEQMRIIAQQTHVNDAKKIAILAALTLASIAKKNEATASTLRQHCTRLVCQIDDGLAYF